jgi:amidase
VSLADVSELTVEGAEAIMPIACECHPNRNFWWSREANGSLKVWEFKNVCIPRFLASFDECPVRSLADIVQFNEDNRDKCLPPRMPVSFQPLGALLNAC